MMFSSLNAPFGYTMVDVSLYEFCIHSHKSERGQKQMRPETREGKGNVMKGRPLAPA